MNLGISGKTVLVTGGTHGIGIETARLFRDEGCRVIVCSRNPSVVSSEFEVYSFDALKEIDIRNVAQQIEEESGGIDILVNNVGGGGRWGKDFQNTELSTWNEVYHKNMIAAILFTQALLPNMVNNKWGRVVTVSSSCGVNHFGAKHWFNVAKAAEIAFMKSMSKDRYYVRNGITFNSVAPGAIMIKDTGWEKEINDNPDVINNYVMGRIGTPEEVASAIVFLCSELASYINGSCLSVDGGL